MAKNKRPKDKAPSLEDRFIFVGDGVSLGERSPLKPALFEVEDRTTGASRKLKLWRKTGGAVDEDLRRLWVHEMRQVQRVMAYVGARDVIVDVLESVEDSENFGVLLECVGTPLSARMRRTGRYHWLQSLSAPRSRTLFWKNSRVEALRNSELSHLFDFRPVRPGNPFVGTVDSFQGSEADLVIISLVRNNSRTGFGALGFLRDQRRMNVALSRAKSQLVIVGSLKFLSEAVRGVNPDEEKHSLSFLTRVVETIETLAKETRATTGLPLASIISPDLLRTRR